jgi:glycosyltransferase involved in cell wall biosynthesis
MGLHVSVVVPVYNERYLVGASLRRLLEVKSPLIDRLDVIVVDDGSRDGSRELLRELAQREPRIEYIEHDRNRGKGAAVRTGIARARGAVTLIHDADLEYDPRDIPALLRPFVEAGADAVYGSRFLGGEYRRVLYFGHTLGNRLITFGADFFTDLNLTDVETCYKAVRTRLLQSIPIRSNDFRLEIELTFKLAKRGARIFEVPISYAGRTYDEGKKIGVTDGVLAFFAMLRWWIVDDIYDPDEYGSNILVALSEVPRFNRWMADTVRPYIGQRVLEIGAGIGNLTRALIPRERYTATDINPHYLDFLENVAESRPYLDVGHLDLADPAAAEHFAGRYDTVVCLNVLEHVPDEDQGARNLLSVLEPGGRAIVLVPQGPSLYGSLDQVLGHRCRYTEASLRAALEKAGFEIERVFGFNRASRPGWWWNGTLLRRNRFSRVQLKLLDWAIWLVRRIDGALPWPGLSLIAVARRPMAEARQLEDYRLGAA